MPPRLIANESVLGEMSIQITNQRATFVHLVTIEFREEQVELTQQVSHALQRRQLEALNINHESVHLGDVDLMSLEVIRKRHDVNVDRSTKLDVGKLVQMFCRFEKRGTHPQIRRLKIELHRAIGRARSNLKH